MIAGENNNITCLGLILKNFIYELGGSFYIIASFNKILITNTQFINFTSE